MISECKEVRINRKLLIDVFFLLIDYQVGYRVRFEDNTGPGTKIIYQTDGMLLREAMLDPRYVLTLKLLVFNISS